MRKLIEKLQDALENQSLQAFVEDGYRDKLVLKLMKLDSNFYKDIANSFIDRECEVCNITDTIEYLINIGVSEKDLLTLKFEQASIDLAKENIKSREEQDV